MLDGPKNVTITPDNVVTLLPILSDAQIMLLLNGMPANPNVPLLANGLPGLTKICSLEKTDALFADIQAALASGEWQVNEKFITLMLESKTETGEPLLDDTMFATFEKTLYDMVPDKDATLDSNLKLLGDAEKADPASINFYAVNFESKEYIQSFIDEYNASVEEKDRLEYTDLVGTLMSSVTIIVDAISYVLIAFVSISLVVSSIMIGIITYISVLERTKEIGILRAIGASKKDISRVFNAETMIIGFAAGAIGILATLLFCIPINLILRAVTDMNNIKAVLPVGAAFILIAISIVLTLIAGLIPSRIASKKDPVVALRTE
jgi:putative ABC transport system permease protein